MKALRDDRIEAGAKNGSGENRVQTRGESSVPIFTSGTGQSRFFVSLSFCEVIVCPGEQGLSLRVWFIILPREAITGRMSLKMIPTKESMSSS